MNRKEVAKLSEEFGKLLVTHVRDRVIRICDKQLDSPSNTERKKRWNSAKKRSPKEFAKEIIPDIVDDTLAYFLIAVDQGLSRLTFTAANGKKLDLTTVGDDFGELSGSYGGGWCEKYSKERWVDDFADFDFEKFFEDSSDSDSESPDSD